LALVRLELIQRLALLMLDQAAALAFALTELQLRRHILLSALQLLPALLLAETEKDPSRSAVPDPLLQQIAGKCWVAEIGFAQMLLVSLGLAQ
jgi:hypothetical protein